MSSAIIPSNFNSGYLASMQQMYGGPSPPHASPGPTQDRPFRCDQCPQSFNRNHDLKRHKRIHLSVKPFPCTHCDKSFSRKDALKVGLVLDFCLLMHRNADFCSVICWSKDAASNHNAYIPFSILSRAVFCPCLALG